MEKLASEKFVGTNTRSLTNDGDFSMSLKKMKNVKDGVSSSNALEASEILLKTL